MVDETALTKTGWHHLMHLMVLSFSRPLLLLIAMPLFTGCALLFPKAPTEIRNTRIQVDSGQTYFGGPLTKP